MNVMATTNDQLINEVNSLFFNTTTELTNEDLLRRLAERIPEIRYYSTLCDATPDQSGNVDVRVVSLVEAVFDVAEVESWNKKKIGEINKVFLRLIYLRSIIVNDRTYFEFLDKDSFYRLRELIKPLFEDPTNHPKKLFFLILSIIFDDLGRTEIIRNIIREHPWWTDHDHCWRKFLNGYDAIDQMIPSFNLLSPEERTLYQRQVSNSFNLGAFVQGESVPYSLYELVSSCEDYYTRIIVLVLAFTSFNYDNELHSIVFTKPMCKQYHTAATTILNSSQEIRTNFHDQQRVGAITKRVMDIYDHYIKARASMARVPVDSLGVPAEEIYPLLRIVALSRAESDLHWRKIEYVWKHKLSQSIKRTLIDEMSVTGFHGEKAIYIYYAPAVIKNTIVSRQEKNRLEQVDANAFERDAWTLGLQEGLEKLASLYDVIKKNLEFEVGGNNGIVLYNAFTDAMGEVEIERESM